MILKITQQDADNTNEYFDAARQKNYEDSFDGVKNFILENKNKLHHSRRRKPVRKWQWALAVLFPMLVALACTKTERTEMVGNTVTFSVPEDNDAARQELETLVGELQTVIVPDKQKPGYLSYTCFIPAQNTRSAATIINGLKGVKGIVGLAAIPVNAQVKESLLSQVGYKIFRTHIDATAMSDDEFQNTVMRQLKEKGFNDISVTVTRNEKGMRTLQLHPTEDANNYLVDVSIDDKGTKMVLQEERKTNIEKSTLGDKSPVDFGSMTDAQVKDYIRRQYGKDLKDENIKITRTAEEIAIDVKVSDTKEEIMRFKLH